MTKTDITNELNKFENFGWNIKTFNYNRKMPSGCRGFVDHVLSHKDKGYLIFIEVKLGKDKENKKQSEYQEICEEIVKVNHYFQYYLMTENNYDSIIKRIYEI